MIRSGVKYVTVVTYHYWNIDYNKTVSISKIYQVALDPVFAPSGRCLVGKWIQVDRSRIVRTAQTEIGSHLLNFLHRAITLLKTLAEKLSRASKVCRSGRVMRTFLCIGVNHSVESPATPYLSSVQRVRTSHLLFSGHQIAWSDQSFDSASTNRQQSTTTQIQKY